MTAGLPHPSSEFLPAGALIVTTPQPLWRVDEPVALHPPAGLTAEAAQALALPVAPPAPWLEAVLAILGRVTERGRVEPTTDSV